MQTSVLLSIKPKFAHAIFDGQKKFEFRKAIFKNRNINKVYVYASAPVSRVIGEFTIEEIISHEPNHLWEITATFAGISREYFDEYFEGRSLGYALKVGSTNRYSESATLMDMFDIRHPPQSFRYISDESQLSVFPA